MYTRGMSQRPIYTKTGDAGTTQLGNETRVPKTVRRIAAVGAIDELNSTVGLAASLLPETSDIPRKLKDIQRYLFDLGGCLALPANAEPAFKERLPDLDETAVTHLEEQIDRWTEQLPELTEFILPGGETGAAALHQARSVSRRAERALLRLHAEHEQAAIHLRWINRLSDYLFTAARFANYEARRLDIPWHRS